MTKGSPGEAQPRVRRGYFECRYGQLHVHNAIPPGGGFEEGTSLLCLHQAGASGRVFSRFLALAGRDRSVYAPDLPGCGESDPPPAPTSIAAEAAAIGDFLDSMRFRQIDVLGYRSGSFVATELAIARPKQIRRVVMVSVPIRTASEPVPAAQQYSARERLAQVPQTVLLLRPKDDCWDAALRARELLPNARCLDLPEQGNAVFETAPEIMVDSVKEFLRG